MSNYQSISGFGISDAYSLLQRAGSTVKPAILILEDPGLPRIINSIYQLQSIEQESPSTSKRVDGNRVPGVGLGKVAPVLEGFVTLRKMGDWALYVVPLAVLGAMFGLGYLIGKK